MAMVLAPGHEQVDDILADVTGLVLQESHPFADSIFGKFGY